MKVKMSGKKKTSQVWEHFTLISNKVALCKHCKEEMSFCNSAGSLMKHLKTKYVYLELSNQSGDSIFWIRNNCRIVNYSELPIPFD